MEEKEISYYIEIIRKHMFNKYKTFPIEHCHETSIIFKLVLEKLNIKSQIFRCSWNNIDHFINKLNDIIIYLTLDQFEACCKKCGVIDTSYYLTNYNIYEEYNIDWIHDIENAEDLNYFENINSSVTTILKEIWKKKNLHIT